MINQTKPDDLKETSSPVPKYDMSKVSNVFRPIFFLK